MGRAGTSKLPCHGCGSTALHFKDCVCDNCARALREHAVMKAERAANPRLAVMVSKERAYALPHIHQTSTQLSDEIKGCFHALTESLSKPLLGTYLQGKEPRIFADDSYGRDDWNRGVLINQAQGELIGKTYQAVRQAIKSAYAKGHADGRNLLGQLAAGHMTADEFNDKAIRAEERQRGLTLIELLIVVAVLGILGAILAPALGLVERQDNRSLSYGFNGVVESRCIGGYQHTIDHRGRATQTLGADGFGIACK